MQVIMFGQTAMISQYPPANPVAAPALKMMTVAQASSATAHQQKLVRNAILIPAHPIVKINVLSVLLLQCAPGTPTTAAPGVHSGTQPQIVVSHMCHAHQNGVILIKLRVLVG